MQSYYKTRTEITKEFGVSEGAVRAWISRAQQGKLDLGIININNKIMILKNQKNISLMKSLVEKGRKHKSFEAKVRIAVNPKAYRHFKQSQIIELLDTLETKRSIPHKYFYLNGGANYWENFYTVSLQDSQYTTSHSDIYYFDTCYKLIKDNLKHFDKINIVDIGAGNGEPAIGLMRKLHQDGLLYSYSAIDISNQMLSHTKKHIEETVPGIITNFHEMDFEKSSLNDILHSIRYSQLEKYPILILGLGGTLFNRNNNLHTFFNIAEAMQKEDILCITNAFASDEASNYKFTIGSIPELYLLHTWLARELGFSEELTEVELRFNENTGNRELNLILKKDLDLVFQELGYNIQLYKNERINLWVHRKDTFNSISKLACDLEMKLKLIIKHPEFENVMYMIGK